MKETDILNFVRTSIGSVSALEVLSVVGDRPERSWRLDELVRELRSSPAAITRAIERLDHAGLVIDDGQHSCRYQPATPELDHVGELVRKIYAVKPAAVIGAMFESSDDKLRAFAEAFKFRE